MPASVSTQYAALLAAGKVEHDLAQEAIVDKLAELERRIIEHRLARKSSSLGWVFGARKRSEEPIRGLYIFGDVGRGKTMLMDLFFAASPVVRKHRAHFHEFMADVHERIYAFRQKHQVRARSPAARIRSSWPPPRSPTRPGCSASTSSTSPTSPTR